MHTGGVGEHTPSRSVVLMMQRVAMRDTIVGSSMITEWPQGHLWCVHTALNGALRQSGLGGVECDGCVHGISASCRRA